jgi:hypothetical protein
MAKALSPIYCLGLDPDTLPGGKIGLELWLSQTEDSMVYYDNFQVCTLSAPFEPLYIVEP